MKWMVRVLTSFGVIELLHEEIWGLRFYVCLDWGCIKAMAAMVEKNFIISIQWIDLG